MLLRFGHLEDKASAVAYHQRSQQRDKLRGNVVKYYRKYVRAIEWPTVDSPHCFYPKTFNRVPLSILQEAAAALQEIRAAALQEQRAEGATARAGGDLTV